MITPTSQPMKPDDERSHPATTYAQHASTQPADDDGERDPVEEETGATDLDDYPNQHPSLLGSRNHLP